MVAETGFAQWPRIQQRSHGRRILFWYLRVCHGIDLAIGWDPIVGADPGSESGAGSACLPQCKGRTRERADT